MRPTIAFLLIVIGVLIILWNPWRPRDVSEPEYAGMSPAALNHPKPAPKVPQPFPEGPLVETKRSPLADDLHAPDGSVQEDLEILMNIFGEYRTILKSNPTGSNPEITRALSGANPRLYAPLPQDHSAINDKGELCDRWGSPYFLHILSRQHLEIRCAGPDRILWSEDDTVHQTTTLSSR